MCVFNILRFFLQTLEQNNKQGAELLLPRCFKIKEKKIISVTAQQ